ncbi:MAG: enterochelin esterase [Gemmatimonadetes bacterium]|nr:enterochelin esterase [Gemmatimonadota bacterium]
MRRIRRPELDGIGGDASALGPTSPAIEALEKRVANDPTAAGRFLAEHRFPIAEPPFYTFAYQGAADGVRFRHWIQGLPTSQPFRRLPGTNLWVHALELPDESRVEYKIEVIRGGHSQWIEDALNPQHARDPFGANSVVTARGYTVPDWAVPSEDVPAGDLDELVVESGALGSARRVSVYRPAGFRSTRRYPLLIVHDGRDYLEYANLRTVLDHLIARFEIPAMVVALTSTRRRLEEYSGDEAHARFIVRELLPRLEDDYPLIEASDGRGLLGASLGAVASFDTALRYPGVFDRLLLQSGSFAFTDIGRGALEPPFDRIVELMNAYRASPTRLAEKAFVSVGAYEPLVAENRALIPVLRRADVDVRFVEARDGHNWENWRDRLREGLSWSFPGPLWMVYE